MTLREEHEIPFDPEDGAAKPTKRRSLWSGFAKPEELFGIDLRSLAAFRIALALVVLAEMVQRAGDFEIFHTEQGVLPIHAVLSNSLLSYGNYLPLYMLSTNPLWPAFLFLLTVLCAGAMLLGWRTRTATVLTWYLINSLQARNAMILNGADVSMRLQLFWAIFLPLGAKWSLDARKFTPQTKVKRPLRAYSIATFALLLQICLVYWFTAILKSDRVWRIDGTAVYYSLRIEQYQTALSPIMLHFPPDVLKFMTFATLYLEGFGTFFAFIPYRNGIFRTLTVAVFLAFHLIALNLTFDLGMLPFTSGAAWLSFLPSDFWDWIEARRSRMQNKSGREPEVSAASAELPPLGLPRFARIVAGFFLVYLLLWNLRSVWFDRFSPLLPAQWNTVAQITRIDQYWALFAPKPMTNDGWYVIPAHLRDGSTVDLFRNGAPFTWKKPERISTLYKNERWRKYMMNVWSQDYPKERVYYAEYLCCTWNRNHPPQKKVDTFKIYFMRKDILPDYKEFTPVPVLLWTHNCFGTPVESNPKTPLVSTK